MKSNARNAIAPLILFAIVSLRTSSVPAAAPVSTVRTVFLAQANPADAKVAEPPAKSPEEKTPEQKKRVKSAVILLSVLSGIALSGLLLIIASISIRGLQRKLAGPTRLDREPADLFPTMVPRPDLDEPPAPDAPAAVDPSS